MSMRRIGGFLLSLSFIYGGPLLAAPQLILQDGVRVLAQNGRLLSDDKAATDRLSLQPGTNQILVRYSVELQGSDGEIEKSDPFVLLFESADEQQLRLSTPKIRRARDLRQFNRQGSWMLTDPAGRKQTFTQAVLKKEGFQLGRDFERELEVFNKTDAAAAYRFNTSAVDYTTTVLKDPISYQPTASIPKGDRSADALMAERMLKYWYNQADQETRESFKAWIK